MSIEQFVYFDPPDSITTLQGQVGLIPNQVNTDFIYSPSGYIGTLYVDNLIGFSGSSGGNIQGASYLEKSFGNPTISGPNNVVLNEVSGDVVISNNTFSIINNALDIQVRLPDLSSIDASNTLRIGGLYMYAELNNLNEIVYNVNGGSISSPFSYTVGNMLNIHYDSTTVTFSLYEYSHTATSNPSNVVYANYTSSGITDESLYIGFTQSVALSTSSITIANINMFASQKLTGIRANSVAIGVGSGQTSQGFKGIAIGYNAGQTNQGDLGGLNTTANSVAIGTQAAQTNQGQSCIAIGYNAGNNTQGSQGIAIGYNAGNNIQSSYSIAVGNNAGGNQQGSSSIAIGVNAGSTSQSSNSIALGYEAGTQSQQQYSTSIGYLAGWDTQGTGSVAIGHNSGYSLQGLDSIAIGENAGQTSQGNYGIALGFNSGNSSQQNYAVAMGFGAGNISQGNSSVAIGPQSGNVSQGISSIAIGSSAGQDNQGGGSIAIGNGAAILNQGTNAISIGNNAGASSQLNASIAIGQSAGNSDQQYNCIAIGENAGNMSQNNFSIGIGYYAAQSSQGSNSIAIGTYAGDDTQGSDSIAIGPRAGKTNQSANSIILNAQTSTDLDSTTSGFFVAPIRNTTGPYALYYNNDTKEITYNDIPSGLTGPTGAQGEQGASGLTTGKLLYLNYPIINSNNPSYYLMQSVPTGGSSQTLSIPFTAGQSQTINFATQYQLDNISPLVVAGLWYTELNAYVGGSGQEFDVNIEIKAATGLSATLTTLGTSSTGVISATSSTIYYFNTVVDSLDNISTDGYTTLVINATNKLASPATLNLDFLGSTYSYSTSTLSQSVFIGPTGPQGIQGIQGLTGPTGSSLWNTSGSNIYYNSGSVGIGKSNPTSTLDIAGTVSITGSTTMYGQLINPTFNAYKETIFISSYSGAFTINASTANNFAITLSSGANSVAFTNFAPTGTLQGVNVFVTQDSSGNRTLSYPSSVSWGTIGAPTLSTAANAVDVLNFVTYSGGSKILGFLSGKGF
jgi:hypothetical protein